MSYIMLYLAKYMAFLLLTVSVLSSFMRCHFLAYQFLAYPYWIISVILEYNVSRKFSIDESMHDFVLRAAFHKTVQPRET